MMIRMFKAHVPMAQCSDVQICRDFLHLNTAIYPTRWPVLNLIVRRSVPVVPHRPGKQTANAGEGSTWRAALGRGYDLRCGKCSG